MIGGPTNYSVSTSYTVAGLTTGQTYRFRYRSVNLVGVSGWSPVSYIQPASVPTTPLPPQYLSSTATTIVLQLFRSDNDGGLPILNYELWIDQGSITSSFTIMSRYVYAVDAMVFTVDSVLDSLTPGLIYRFKFRSVNTIGYSAFSDNVMLGLGPLPVQASPVSRAAFGNSPTSIGVEWSPVPSVFL